LGKTYPALEVRCDDADLVLALIDDFHPTALEERDGAARVFFASSAERDAARDALETRYHVEAFDVPDEDWARRSQANLQPITIGRLTVFPTNPKSLIPNPCSIVIQPSMGFGTGHHATTQLCVEALQAIDVSGAHVLDVGTGSGVLAIAAVRLGAARALGIDVDEDAITAARENLTLNPGVADRVRFDVADVGSLSSSGGFTTVASGASTELRAVRSLSKDGFSRTSGPPAASALRATASHAEAEPRREGGSHVRFETASPLTFAPTIVTANLTGALLARTARTLIDAVGDGGILVLSGLQLHERDEVMRAFAGTSTTWDRTVGEWVGVAVKKT
jgi:ribosomal protein L11 methylase PrmA